MTNQRLIEDRKRERKRREIEKLVIDRGFDLGALGAEESGFKREGQVFFFSGFKTINKVTPYTDYTGYADA